MDGGSVEVLADDVFLAGAGYEKLIGDKLFYGYGYDENHSMQYAWVDILSSLFVFIHFHPLSSKPDADGRLPPASVTCGRTDSSRKYLC